MKQDKDLVRILGIAPYEGMQAAMERAVENNADIHLDVYTGDLEEGVTIVREHQAEDYDCILSRGGTARMIQQVTNIPVVEIPVSVYDVLRTMRLAENYVDRYAIVGFPNITETAHTLCDLLKSPVNIVTIHSPQEISQVLSRLQTTGYRMVIGDMVTNTMARELGMNAFLITSGVESLHAALEQASSVGRSFRHLRHENLILSKILGEEAGSTLVLNESGQIYYPQNADPSAELLTLLRGKIPEIPPHGTLQFYHNRTGTLYRVVAQLLRTGGGIYYLFHYSAAQIPLRSGKSGLRSLNKNECEHLFTNSFYFLSGALGELEPKILSVAATRKPVMILGETGTGKEQIALLIYLRSTLSSRPYVVVDCAQANDKGWDFLLNHYSSPLNDNNNTIFFQNFESAPENRAWDLLSSIQASDLAGRNRLLFSCTCPEGGRMPDSAEKLVQQLACLILTLPTLRSRQDEIPSLASLYLGNLNLELGKQISGFDAHAIEQLRRFDWPGNYTQFKRVIQELATITDSYYIRNTDVAEILSRERRLSAPARQEDIKKPSLTLKQIIRQAVEQALQENDGNQTAAARQLGIGRTTLWRYINNEE
ncbi:MAG: PrpR N-terminal domain-containing protein [Eubacteriales bacterium]|nr:PrpR N-terminal domain-containing protein [Eubacteriales bacterium]